MTVWKIDPIPVWIEKTSKDYCSSFKDHGHNFCENWYKDSGNLILCVDENIKFYRWIYFFEFIFTVVFIIQVKTHIKNQKLIETNILGLQNTKYKEYTSRIVGVHTYM